MKRFALLAIVLIVALPVFAGNGATSGSHYNLNIIGMDTCKTQDLIGTSGHTIFVDLNYSDPTPTIPTPTTSLNPKNKIFLQEGSFAVIDRNACDGAVFQLPQNVCSTFTIDTVAGCTYDVYVRALGSPQGNPYAQMTTCRIDKTINEYQCSTETVTVQRFKSKSTFTNVTKELTSLCLDTLADGVYDGKCDERVVLFESEMYKYFWDYDNHGLRLAQLRFYPN